MPNTASPRPLPRDLVAASTTPLVLAILARGDSYGYAIIRDIDELSGGEMAWADGMLYPILHRLEERGLIEAYWGRSEQGRRRKYYRLVARGRAELESLRGSWLRIQRLFETIAGETEHV